MPGHLDDAILEDHARGKLAATELDSTVRHLSHCEECAARYATVVRQVGLLKAALAEVAEEPLDFTHQTKDGPVHLHAARRRGKWIAVVGGGKPELRLECRTSGAANAFLRRTFEELYADHECSESCRPGPPK